MNRNEYCDRVLAQVGRLTSDEANDLRNELAGHIEDHAEALVEHGYTEEDAAARAVALMGDPEETGRALCAQYGGWWLVIVQRAARILTAVLCVMIAGLIVKSSGLYGAIRDRYEVQKPGEGWERWNTETPGTRIPIGDDIVRIDTVSCSTQRAEVQLTAFDRIPGGVVYARLLHTLRLENERGEVIDEWEDCDYPSCVSSSGTLYVCIASHRVISSRTILISGSFMTGSASMLHWRSHCREGRRSRENDQAKTGQNAPRGQERCRAAVRAGGVCRPVRHEAHTARGDPHGRAVLRHL